jgi:peptidoglycan/LPS O-acetylase OafA/YrhL
MSRPAGNFCGRGFPSADLAYMPPPPDVSPPPESSPDSAAIRWPILDKLRLLAIVYVTIHHVRSVGGLPTWPPSVSLGDLGIGIFCVISGYLAFRTAERPWPWLRKRLLRLYPAYWIATILAFALNWATHYKAADLGLFASQLTGLGYFWYGREALVNQPTWFVSLILLCYGVAFIAKCARRPALGLMVALLAAGGVCIYPGSHPAAVFLILFCLAGLAAIAGVQLPRRPSPRWLALPTDYIYEYFLVHGIFIAGAAKLFPTHPMLAACTIGVAASAIAAVGLKWLVRWAIRMFGGGSVLPGATP